MRKKLFYDRTGFSLSESCLLDFLADSLHGSKESGTKSIWNSKKIAAPTEIDDQRPTVRKRRKKPCTTHKFKVICYRQKKSAERENVINLLATISPRGFFVLDPPSAAFFLSPRTFDSFDANYAISYALNIYDSQHSIMITRGNIKAGKAWTVSHPLSTHKSFKDVRQKSREINKQKKCREGTKKEAEKSWFFRSLSLCCLFWYGNKVKLTNLLLRAKCK